MGYHTDFVGTLSFDKPLSAAQVLYIRKFNETRRMNRNPLKVEKMPDPLRVAVGLPVGDGGGYFVGGKGSLGQGEDSSIVSNDGYNNPPHGQPGLWCQWTVNESGAELMWDEGEKFYYYVEWLVYLIDHFFKPWGVRLTGNITWQGERAGDIGTIEVRDNRVTKRPGVSIPYAASFMASALPSDGTFKCPKCKGTQLECCQTDAILTTDISVVDGEVIYGTPEISDATTDRFQCKNCGWKVPGVTDDDELVEWLQQQ